MSESISCSDALAAIRRGERLPRALIRSLGENQSAEFFRIIVESLADSFDAHDAAAYADLMQAWIERAPRIPPVIPARVDTVYVLSRVTLGSEIKITGVVLDAMKRRFPKASIVLVSDPKCAGLYAADPRVSNLKASYPRSGPVSARIAFAHTLAQRLQTRQSIVVDPDSRITQLGLLPLGDPAHYFHFPSRTANSASNLTQLTQNWLIETFGESGDAWLATEPALPVPREPLVRAPYATISLGVGGNDSKRLPGDFESRLLRLAAERYELLWLDRGAGGAEAERVTAAAAAAGEPAARRIRFWEGSFAGFASLVARSAFYAGYDSAGQHAAAACSVPLVTIFAGAPSTRFRERWAPAGRARIDVIDADRQTPAEVLECISAIMNYP